MADLTGFWYILTLAGVSVVGATLALVVISRIDLRRADRQELAEEPAFLFDQCFLVDASPAGWDILHASNKDRSVNAARGDHQDSDTLTEWRALYRALKSRFPALPEMPEMALEMAPTTLCSAFAGDDATLDLSLVRGKLRLSITDTAAPSLGDRHVALTAARELQMLNSVSHLYPHPVWLRGDDGSILWVNKALRDLAGDGDIAGLCRKLSGPEPTSEASQSTRTLTEDETGESHWFDVLRARSDAGIELGLAIDVNAVVMAEIKQRKFVQTLTKTFAQLSTGLAVFDRHQQLQLFNPALMDLLSLPGDFLSARPTLLTFFDKLRENQMMPEPKNYSGWRQQIAELVSASEDGRYQETWTLPTGLTYRVTGRPHPDGAIALLFDDISAEISLTRRFRGQLNLGQDVFDTLDEGLAVFSSRGVLVGSNLAFRQLWGLDPESSFADVTIRDARRHWKTRSRETTFWDELHDFVLNAAQREEWFADIEMAQGQRVECRVTPLKGGVTLIGFRLPQLLKVGPRGGAVSVSETGKPG
ncbi:PAS-domain containing protein [Rhodalgimonas zhirmunskyi]|uniref:PAS-domain containing protein n=1 Tax=Rhodalgimonas zhirmunskyi TaxID=2964767 RepID=A0AAJ1UDC1_9RHOB|nr:PAS-domain containing protein [Rhodoalgimonas zhirmunskyi]MDQ2094331.1 PAS-domain containing protein [Rhodoalgimonas zhirmunskyi]